MTLALKQQAMISNLFVSLKSEIIIDTFDRIFSKSNENQNDTYGSQKGLVWWPSDMEAAPRA